MKNNLYISSSQPNYYQLIKKKESKNLVVKLNIINKYSMSFGHTS